MQVLLNNDLRVKQKFAFLRSFFGEREIDDVGGSKTHKQILDKIGMAADFEISAGEAAVKNDRLLCYPVAADASFRKYDRIVDQGKSYILMDSPPCYYSLTPFVQMAEFLLDSGLNAPKIYHADHENGFLLLEDFGDTTIAKYLVHNENTLQYKVKLESIYKACIELLVKVQRLPMPDHLASYDNELLLHELELYTDWYVPFVLEKSRPSKVTEFDKVVLSAKKAEFLAIWRNILEKRPKLPICLTLRDYHVENIMFNVADKADISNIHYDNFGLLDFQDAVIGSPAYDLVSILEDARYELGRQFALECLDYYCNLRPELNKDELMLDYHILGGQRNSRIVGVFARKALRDNNRSYLKYIPRVLKYLEYDLSDLHLKPLKIWMQHNKFI